jgi:hypothetical protein
LPPFPSGLYSYRILIEKMIQHILIINHEGYPDESLDRLRVFDSQPDLY